MTATVPDVDTIEHLDFDPACQVVDCDRPGAFHWASIPCPCTDKIACKECTEDELRKLATAGTREWHCTICRLEYGVGIGLLYFRIEPLP